MPRKFNKSAVAVLRKKTRAKGLTAGTDGVVTKDAAYSRYRRAKKRGTDVNGNAVPLDLKGKDKIKTWAQDVERTTRAKKAAAKLKGKGPKTSTQRAKESRTKVHREEVQKLYQKQGGKLKTGAFKNYTHEELIESKAILKRGHDSYGDTRTLLKDARSSIKTRAIKKGVREGKYSVRDIEKLRQLKGAIATNEKAIPALEKKLQRSIAKAKINQKRKTSKINIHGEDAASIKRQKELIKRVKAKQKEMKQSASKLEKDTGLHRDHLPRIYTTRNYKSGTSGHQRTFPMGTTDEVGFISDYRQTQQIMHGGGKKVTGRLPVDVARERGSTQSLKDMDRSVRFDAHPSKVRDFDPTLTPEYMALKDLDFTYTNAGGGISLGTKTSDFYSSKISKGVQKKFSTAKKNIQRQGQPIKTRGAGPGQSGDTSRLDLQGRSQHDFGETGGHMRQVSKGKIKVPKHAGTKRLAALKKKIKS